MNTLWQSFALAWQFLTIVPLPKAFFPKVKPQTLASSFRWYPVVGFLVGVILVLSDWLLSGFLDGLVVNLLLLTILVLLTGGLHQDGLADTIDALAGGRSAEHRLSILRDGRIGAIGATGLVLALGLRYTGLHSMPPDIREPLLLCMPMMGRWSMVMGSWLVTYPRPEGGLAAPFIEHISAYDVLWATVFTGLGGIALCGVFNAVILMIFALSVTRLIVWGSSSLFGGVTGDILGSINEITEILFLIAAPTLSVYFLR
jgi:adenosylcobinamide-GDP ribazoletransferase